VPGIDFIDFKKKPLKISYLIIILFFVLFYCYAERTERNPKYGRIFYRLGLECLEKCELNEQLRYFRKAVYYDPNISDAYYHLGIVYGKKGKVKREIENYGKAAQIDPTHDKAIQKLGIHYYEEGNLHQAIRYLNQAFHLGKDFARTNYYLGRTYESKKEYKKAAGYYQKAYRYNQDFMEAYMRAFALNHLVGDDFYALRQVEKLRHFKKNHLAQQLEDYIREGQPIEDVSDVGVLKVLQEYGLVP